NTAMSSYHIYKKIYNQHYGPIPIDESGRKYDIHHIDGNRSNNHPLNLKAVSIQDHYDIHHKQGDWGACQNIVLRMNKDPKEVSKIVSKLMKKNKKERLQKGIHHFQNSEWQRKNVLRQLEEGRHPCQKKSFLIMQRKRLKSEKIKCK